ncbi:GNAT family N-acetyltransferase [Cupriavidus pauculus]|uniref:GNAT family N-acetyltransferase n=1 Tax=Cupriavidus pauculus TaxID=82633 RepID=UPI001EE2AECD|nr:GNAT family N-acetyltransferase [Cupriavidus pauculus]GJG98439.1 GNAT family N-acetyltransferase [Cupriavidus pauculus]
MSADAIPPSTPPRLPLHTTLRGGQPVVLRKIREDDKAGILEAFALLSEDSRYTRFMAAMHDLPEALLDDVVHPVPGRDCTITAVSGTSEAGHLVGGARYVALPGRDACEFAVTVLDGWHHTGLGRLLMQTLIAHARAAGVGTMEGYVLAANRSMRGLARRLGFSDTVFADDPTLHVVTLVLHPAPGG